jgi:hypothetical protein
LIDFRSPGDHFLIDFRSIDGSSLIAFHSDTTPTSIFLAENAAYLPKP